MTMLLKSVELHNIRSHDHVLFEPAKSGITAISGRSGVGKSTIVDSVAWVLYGTKPEGVGKVAALVKEGKEKEGGRAKVELITKDGVLAVERRLVIQGAKSTTECDVWLTREGSDEPEHLAGPSVKYAEGFLKKSLMVDEAGFLAAMFVRQKQVDQLVSSTPKDRGAVIEKLTGISSISLALTDARKVYNETKKELKLYDIDPGEIDKVKKELESAQKALVKVNSKVAKEDERHLEEKEKLSVFAKELNEAEESERKVSESKSQIDTLETKIETSEMEFNRLNELKNEKRDAATSLKILNASEAEKEAEKLRDEYSDENNKLLKFVTTMQSYSGRLNAARSELEQTGVNDAHDISTRLTEATQALEEHSKTIDNLKDTISGKAQEMRSLASAIKTLQSHGGSCPTCLQQVDDTESAVNNLKSLGAAARQVSDEAKVSLAKTQADRELVEKNLSTLELANKLSQEISELESRIDKGSKIIVTQEGLVKELQVSLKEAERKFLSLQGALQAKKEYDGLLHSCQELTRSINEMKKRRSELKEGIKGYKPKNVSRLRERKDAVQEKVNEIVLGISQLREDRSVYSENVRNLERNLEHLESEMVSYKSVLKRIERDKAVVDTLEKFKQDRVSNAVPMVEQYASEMISLFSDGYFTGINLDEKFAVTVTLHDGHKRAVGLLSGGELSLAAISLRLAISMMLNDGGENGFIILDEVLVSQDNMRGERILNSIKELNTGQVILVSHSSNTKEVSDAVVEL